MTRSENCPISGLWTFCALLLLQSCAASGPAGVTYDPASGLSTYTSSRVLIGYRDMSGGLVSGQRVMLQAVASCPGANCTPEQVELAFTNNSDTDLNLDRRRLQLVFDETIQTWEDAGVRNEQISRAIPRGEFLRVALPAADFARMTGAQQVEFHFGMSGSAVFILSFNRRAEFRTLAEEMGFDE